MKEIDELQFPDNIRYTKEHEWARPENDLFVVGISDYAQDQLGDIVYVDLPSTGSKFKQGTDFGSVESVKAVSELYMPISGEVMAVNTQLEESPELVNTEPYGKGWMIKIKPRDPGEYQQLMDRKSYLATLKG